MRLENSHRRKLSIFLPLSLHHIYFPLKILFFFDYKFMLISFVIRDANYIIVWMEGRRRRMKFHEVSPQTSVMCFKTPKKGVFKTSAFVSPCTFIYHDFAIFFSSRLYSELAHTANDETIIFLMDRGVLKPQKYLQQNYLI